MKTLIVLIAVASFAHGAMYYLQPDGKVTTTATAPKPTTDKVAELEARIAQLERQLGVKAPAPVAIAPQTVIVPPGQHAHRRSDGTVFTHGNENLGNPAAHVGVPHPWPRIAEAGQTVTSTQTATSSTATYTIQSSGCPGGVCPTPAKSGWYLGKNLGR